MKCLVCNRSYEDPEIVICGVCGNDMREALSGDLELGGRQPEGEDLSLIAPVYGLPPMAEEEEEEVEVQPPPSKQQAAAIARMKATRKPVAIAPAYGMAAMRPPEPSKPYEGPPEPSKPYEGPMVMPAYGIPPIAQRSRLPIVLVVAVVAIVAALAILLSR